MGTRHSHFKPSWVTQLLFPWFYPQRCWIYHLIRFRPASGLVVIHAKKNILTKCKTWRSGILAIYNDLSGRQKPKMSAEVILNSGHSEFIGNLPVAVVQRRTGWWGSSMMWWNWAWCEETDVELLLGDSHDHLGMLVASKREPHSTISWSMSVFKSKGFEFGLSKSFIYSSYLSSYIDVSTPIKYVPVLVGLHWLSDLVWFLILYTGYPWVILGLVRLYLHVASYY